MALLRQREKTAPSWPSGLPVAAIKGEESELLPFLIGPYGGRELREFDHNFLDWGLLGDYIGAWLWRWRS